MRKRHALLVLIAVSTASGLVGPADAALAAPSLRTLSWSDLTAQSAPPGRFLASMAYDPHLRATILVGGLTGTIADGDSWSWDGTAWHQMPTAPTPRQSSVMAYDPVHKELVLFGGCGPVNVAGVGCALGDTWLLSPSGTWSEVTPATSPPATYAGAMAWDPVKKNMVLFGGCSTVATPSNQQWIWNGSTWSQSAISRTPPADYDMSMVTDTRHSDIVLFGGEATTGTSNQTWTFNGSSWKLRKPKTSPPILWEFGFAWSPALRRAVLFGGVSTNQGYLSGTWTWNGYDWLGHAVRASPPLREGPSLATDLSGGILLFGGSPKRFNTFDDTWQLSPHYGGAGS